MENEGLNLTAKDVNKAIQNQETRRVLVWGASVLFMIITFIVGAVWQNTAYILIVSAVYCLGWGFSHAMYVSARKQAIKLSLHIVRHSDAVKQMLRAIEVAPEDKKPLEELLEDALKVEDYEEAARIRKILEARKKDRQ